MATPGEKLGALVKAAISQIFFIHTQKLVKMVSSAEILTLTRQIISEHGTDDLYAKPLNSIADKNQLNSLLSRCVETDAETLADCLVDSLEGMDEADVVVEEIIEYVGNHKDFENFHIIAEDEDLGEHTPIYLLEEHGAF